MKLRARHEAQRPDPDRRQHPVARTLTIRVEVHDELVNLLMLVQSLSAPTQWQGLDPTTSAGSPAPSPSARTCPPSTGLHRKRGLPQDEIQQSSS